MFTLDSPCDVHSILHPMFYVMFTTRLFHVMLTTAVNVLTKPIPKWAVKLNGFSFSHPVTFLVIVCKYIVVLSAMYFSGRAANHDAVGHWIIPTRWTHCAICHSSQSSTTGVEKAIVCAFQSV